MACVLPLLRSCNHMRHASLVPIAQVLVQTRPFECARWFSNHGSTTDSENVEVASAEDKPKSVPVHVAYDLLQSGHQYLDVRTVDEFKAGHLPKSVNIPYQFKTESGMLRNPKFLEEVSIHFEKDDEIVVGCRSGKRSLLAAAELKSAGYTHAIDLAGGYLSWIDKQLPTTK